MQGYVYGNELGRARLGIIVGRREVPRAVDRNRIKRLLRETFRHLRGGLGSIDVVLRVRRRLDRAQVEALSREIPVLWRKLAS